LNVRVAVLKSVLNCIDIIMYNLVCITQYLLWFHTIEFIIIPVWAWFSDLCHLCSSVSASSMHLHVCYLSTVGDDRICTSSLSTMLNLSYTSLGKLDWWSWRVMEFIL
jgi:hypothetical protein